METLGSIDLSGFTRLGERLAHTGRGGAEELNQVINSMWTGVIPCALGEGGDILPFGGDALHPTENVSRGFFIQPLSVVSGSTPSRRIRRVCEGKARGVLRGSRSPTSTMT